MRYAVFLRGVNVGAHNRIKMANFKRALEEMGFSRVETYVQSGNAAFDSEKDEATLADEIRAALMEMGVITDAVAFSAEKMRGLLEDLSFSDAEIAGAKNTE